MALLHRFAVLCAAVACAAVGTAAPAPAATVPPADGYYTYTEAGKPAATWAMQTVCSQPSGTRAQPDYSDVDIQTLGCIVNVTSTTRKRLTHDEKLLSVAGPTRLINGLWNLDLVLREGQICPDGSTALLQQQFEFSEVTLTGTRTTLWGTECGAQPGMTKAPFSLAFLGPLDPPADNRFPMQCDYLAGRPSICS